MSNPSGVVHLELDITGNITASNMRKARVTDSLAISSATQGVANAADWKASGIEAGGRVDLGTATTADVLVKDGTGKVLISTVTYTSDTDILPIPTGVTGPITVTVTNISNAAHTLKVHWWVKR
jgi:hypothetical protein